MGIFTEFLGTIIETAAEASTGCERYVYDISVSRARTYIWRLEGFFTSDMEVGPGQTYYLSKYARELKNDVVRELTRRGQSALTPLATDTLMEKAIRAVVSEHRHSQAVRREIYASDVKDRLMAIAVSEASKHKSSLALYFSYDRVSGTATLKSTYRYTYQSMIKSIARDVVYIARAQGYSDADMNLLDLEDIERAIGQVLKQYFESGTRQFRFQ